MQAMTAALATPLTLPAIGYINAHRDGDSHCGTRRKSHAVRFRCLGTERDQDPMSPIKSMVGHTRWSRRAQSQPSRRCAVRFSRGILPPTKNCAILKDSGLRWLDYMPGVAGAEAGRCDSVVV